MFRDHEWGDGWVFGLSLLPICPLAGTACMYPCCRHQGFSEEHSFTIQRIQEDVEAMSSKNARLHIHFVLSNLFFILDYLLCFIIELDQVILSHVIGARVKWYAYAQPSLRHCPKGRKHNDTHDCYLRVRLFSCTHVTSQVYTLTSNSHVRNS